MIEWAALRCVAAPLLCAVRWLVFVVAILTPVFLWAQQTPPFMSRYDERLLGERGFANDRATLLDFIRPRKATLEERLHYKNLVQDFGAASFAKRESAARELRKAGAPAKPFLEKAARSAHIEIRRRAAALLNDIKQAAEQEIPLRLAALRYLANQPSGDDLALLFDVLAGAESAEMRRTCQTAILVNAQPQDQSLLKQRLQTGAAPSRIVALQSLYQLQRADDLESFLSDHDPRLRLVAAGLFAKVNIQRSLDVALSALAHSNVVVRAEAADLLRAATGQQFGFAAYDSPERRERAQRAWRDWIEKQADSLPVVTAPLAVDRLRHRVLTCEIDPLAVHEFDLLTGELVFQSDAVIAPVGAACYSEGWRILADLGASAIVALGPTGKKAHQLATPDQPTCLESLATGHFLLGTTNESETRSSVVEIDEMGKVLWRAKVAGLAVDAHRLENGNTLVTNYSQKKIIELTPDGNIVWQIDALQPPESARRLSNGNTLVATTLGKVREFSPRGEVVWSASRLPMAYDALELPSGNVLAAYRNGLREIGRDGVVVREIKAGTVRRLFVY